MLLPMQDEMVMILQSFAYALAGNLKRGVPNGGHVMNYYDATF